jgi:hypothetical protein
MIRVYKRSDRISVKVDGITVKLAPLTLAQKTEIQQAMLSGINKSDLKESTRGIMLSLKYSLKGIDGLDDVDGNKYQLEFQDDELTDACVDDLMNLELSQKLAYVCSNLVKGIPKSFTDHNGNLLDGVELVTPPKDAPEGKS